MKSPINPFFEKSPFPFEYPAFDRIQPAHFQPAFEQGMQDQLLEIEAIIAQKETSFENTLLALESSGQLLHRVSAVFFNLTHAHSNDSLKALQLQISPHLAAHKDAIFLNPKLFEKIKVLKDQDHSALDAESQRLIQKYYEDFLRAGAGLSAVDKEALRTLNQKISKLSTQLQQNILNEVNNTPIVVHSVADLEGLPETKIAAAQEKAQQQGLKNAYVISLQNTSSQPILADLKNRALRERIHAASLGRGKQVNDYDNRTLFSALIQARKQKAHLLGYAHYADYALASQSAKNSAAVNDFLNQLAPIAVKNAQKEAQDLQALIDEESEKFSLAAWDWPYYAQKLKQQRFDLDIEKLSRYFELNRVLTKGVFYTASRLYGISFEEKHSYPVYHSDVRVFEVIDADGSVLGLFLFDPFARESKHGGAWMSTYVPQSKLLGQKPVIANHLNITKPVAGQPALLSFNEVITMFHEFGHALHGLFSAVSYPYFSGTAVPRDFVEFPSQLNEIWATCPEILQNYAVDYETKAALPPEWIAKIEAASQFNQGYATTEYLAAAILDQSWHQLDDQQQETIADVMVFEKNALQAAGIDLDCVPPRYRSPYFSHILGGYAAGYYAYIWSEVLDADAEQYFKEKGILNKELGQHLRDCVLSKGGSVDPESQYRSFRGADAKIAALLKRRGLA